MTAKKWLAMFIAALAVTAAIWAGFNIVTDPYGVFGDRFLNFYSYDMTRNPRVAKIAWLDEHHEDYDSYIIGCSGSSSIPVEPLNEAFDASFYNMIMYGADMLDLEQTAVYLADNYEVKNLVVSLYVDNGISYDVGEDSLDYRVHAKVSGKSLLRFYLDYLFLNPSYGIDKIKCCLQDTELPQVFDVFDVESGVYDKRVRDVEPIGSLEKYVQQPAYQVFTDYPAGQYGMPYIEKCVEGLTAIRDLCEQRGINLIVVNNPCYVEYLRYFSNEDLAQFVHDLSQVTPIWDFSYSSVSYDPRYWYDKTHFRNSIGESMVAVITGDESIYIPEGFGRYVTADMPADSGYFAQDCSVPAENYTASVPVLMYHHLNDSGEGSSTIQTETFRAHMEAIKDAGYQTVSLEEIYNYVWYGTPLPENPIAITFDDGYTSNYELAYPILKELDMQAAIFAIGVSVGKDTYKDTNYEMTPHFSWKQANEMISSGLITVQTHTYDFHQWPPYEAEGSAARENVLPLAGETEEHYMEAFGADLSRARQELEQETGQNCYVLAYPEGASTTLSAVVAAQSGIRMTFSTTAETSTLVKGLPQSLLNIPRYGIDDMTADELLRLLDGETAS